jgi:sulfur-carrier protein
MTVTVRYWAAARAAAGTVEDQVDAATVGQALRAAQALHGPELTQILEHCALLVDGVQVGGERDDRPLDDGSIVECLPPFAGGS